MNDTTSDNPHADASTAEGVARRSRDPDATRQRLHRAAVHLIACDHVWGASASVRAITKAAGVTEGTLYRHYTSRDELASAAYEELVRPMIGEKENLVAMVAPLRVRVREWVRCTYAWFDRDPDAFAFVFLAGVAPGSRHEALSRRQSELFAELHGQGKAMGEARDLDTRTATTLFIGLLMSVPMRLREGTLEGPAARHVDMVADAAWRVLALGEF